MKVKRILLPIIMLCMLLTVPMYAKAEGTVDDSAASTVIVASGTCGDNLTWVIQDDTLKISGTGEMYDYGTDGALGTAPWCTYLLKVSGAKLVVEDGVTSIGEYAFYFTSISSVELPDTLETIEYGAFWGCTGLTSVTIPDSVTTLEGYAFQSCNYLTELKISSSLTTIPLAAFEGCNHLPSVTIPSSVTTIGERAFCGCTYFTSIEIPSTVKKIDTYAFHGCTSLEMVVFQDGLETIVAEAFDTCPGIKEMYFYGDAPSIGEDAFRTIKDAIVYYPEGNETWTSMNMLQYGGVLTWQTFDGISKPGIGSGDCGDGVTWELKNGTLTISGNGAMTDYSSLSYVPWGDLYVRDCIEKIVVEEGVTHIGKYAFHMDGTAKSVELPESLQTIGQNGFSYCMSLESISIPGNVTRIGIDAFKDAALKEIYFTGNAPNTIYSNTFYNVTADVYYPLGNTTWTSGKLQNYGGALTWHGYGKLEDATVTLAYTSTTYTGAAKKPAVTISGLTQGIDFTVSYSNNVNAGTATVTITGIGDYTGTVTKTFKINKVSSSKLTATLARTSQAYTSPGVALPGVTVKNASGTKLVKGTDYTVTYPSNFKNPGSYTIKIVCKGNYTGTIKKTFKIVPTSTSISKLTKAKKAFTVKWKKNKTQTTGYQIQYSTSKKFSSGVKTVTITKNTTTSKKITGLKSKKTYYVRVRTYKTVSGTKYYSSWSAVKSVTTK